MIHVRVEVVKSLNSVVAENSEKIKWASKKGAHKNMYGKCGDA